MKDQKSLDPLQSLAILRACAAGEKEQLPANLSWHFYRKIEKVLLDQHARGG